jgi:uncharacterized peroxidase-related enzyme
MPHITLDNELPGISGLIEYRPETGIVLSTLAEVLLRGENSLSRGDRELIAARVSTLNQCKFCTASHAAFAAAQLPGGVELVEHARIDPDAAPLTPKLKALLQIASAVQVLGTEVTTELIDQARAEGATDIEIHDTVLIAAAFCMYNRYVDGLATFAPSDPEVYHQSAKVIVGQGYLASHEKAAQA